MPPEARCAYEIVIDGLTLEAVERATAAGLHAATLASRMPWLWSRRATTAASSGRFTSGCTTSSVDIRRRSEPDFWESMLTFDRTERGMRRAIVGMVLVFIVGTADGLLSSARPS